MNKTTAAAFALGVVVGFIASTWGAATAMAGQTAERDIMRDDLTAKLAQAVDTGADLIRQARQKQTEAEQALADATPKQVKKHSPGTR